MVKTYSCLVWPVSVGVGFEISYKLFKVALFIVRGTADRCWPEGCKPVLGLDGTHLPSQREGLPKASLRGIVQQLS